MNDESYELVSKSYIEELKEENKKLKKQLNDKTGGSKEKIPQIQTILEETKKERDEIKKYLNDIKELNQKTLNSTLSKSASIENKFEDMVSTLKDLILNLNEMISTFPNENDYVKEIITELQKNKINLGYSSNNLNGNSDDVIKKLVDIELFLNNLRVLLSYVKPNDLIVDKK